VAAPHHMTSLSVITISIDPNIHLGPVTVAWHGLMIAIGILVGGLAAARFARERRLDLDPLYTIGVLLAVGGIVGGRVFYVVEHGGPLFGTRGFTFDGGVILAALLIALYVWRQRLGARYLDVVAFGLPLGVAVGRIGDVINGEHYGPRSDFFLAVRNAHPDALTPNPDFAYHNGGLYEVLLGAAIFALVWPLRHRLRRPGNLVWLVLGLFAAGRFFEFFVRSDSPELALGLNNAQWTSLGLLVIVAIGWRLTAKRGAASPRPSARGPRTGEAGPPAQIRRGQDG
jgi:phosphatidylglycerol:prolipoprotein diacylglycerol transferase